MLQVARRLWSRLLSGYWFIPSTAIVITASAALALTELDHRLAENGQHLGFTGGPASARALLSTIADSMLTLTALVFSVTVVVLQLASGQFSPRVLRTFLRDHRNQLTLAVFLSTFVYALVVLREVRGDEGAVDRFVPGVAIAVSFALVLVSVVFFVQYINNIVRSLRVIEIIERITSETVQAIERMHPDDPRDPVIPDDVPPSATVAATRRGAITAVEVDRLARIADAADVVFVVVPQVGDFVAAGMPLVAVHGRGEFDHGAVRAAVALAKERDLGEDPRFGFRQIVDIAERALSPGTNDPTTATQCVDHLHDLLRRLACRPLVARTANGRGGSLRAVVHQPDWDDYVSLAFDEIRHWGADALQIHTRIAAALDDLSAVAPPDRLPAIARQRLLLEGVGGCSPGDEAARANAMPRAGRPDTSG